ncbi:MAG TPA: cobalamin B12-binding domain-containing protein [Dehalococcoidia bacterium]|nr:cobalamin B12-binding domain-containing protein [Dehalococcoidia bacterium]
MHALYEQFLSYLDKDDRFGCVDFILTALQKNDLDIVTLYDEILAPSLRESFCREKQKAICIWEEHVRTSIIRTVIECCYPYVVKERDGKYRSAAKGKVIVVCPPEELHEIGARMVADFFTICGFDAIFVGANTPQAEILEAIGYVKPKYVGISVTNYYNLVAARKTISRIRELRQTTDADFKIIAGGLAFEQNPCACDDVGVDLLLHNFEDIKNLS